jgi:hypothetical protein
MVVLCMSWAVASGLQHAARQIGHTWMGTPLAIIVTVLGFGQVNAQGGMTILSADWKSHSFFEQLANADTPQAILEFPVGLGHATAPHQLIHEWRRSESHHDYIAALKADERPEDCYTSPIFDSLWPLSQGRDVAGPSPSDLTDAFHDGFRYLVVYKAGFDVLRQAGIAIDRARSIRTLRRSFGTPLINDRDIVVFAVESKP